MNEILFEDLINRIKKENILNLVIMKDEEIVADYNKKDEYKESKFIINSCTKSIISALIGIAISEGLILGVNQPISDYFPELKEDSVDKRKKDITIYHLLTMSSGISWPEFNNWAFISELMQSHNWVNFILDRPMEANPGERFNYSSGGSHLLSAIISRSTGMNAYTFAQKHLFKPLGINNITWMSDPQGNSNGGFGIAMSAYDMVKIGKLYLDMGKYGDAYLIPKEWVRESLKPGMLASKAMGNYGYQWWMKDFKYPTEIVTVYFAMGNGGQFNFVVPSKNMVAVFISDNYEDSFRPLYYLRKYILKMF